MTKNTEHIQHVKSSVVENGKPKLPQPSVLVEGEIAVNYATDYETISLKNSSGDIVTFSSDNYYTEQKLGSGFTGENSATTVTEAIENSREVEISSGVTPDGTFVLWVDESEDPVEYEAYTKEQVDNMLSEKQGILSAGTGIDITDDVISVTSITITVDQVIDSGTSASTNAVSTSAVYGFVTSYTPSITVDQVLDGTTSASTNPVSSKAVYDAVTDNELVWTNAYVTLSGVVSSHTENANIHVTSADKTVWNAKADISDIPSVSGYADSVKYNSTSHYVEFYHGTTAGTKVFEYDASPFIIDGMVQNVEIKDVTSGGSEVTCLVISFNTDAGKQDINVPISDIFDASNYYDKDEIDDLVGSGFTSSSITDVIIENEEIVSAALTDLDDRKLDATAYTPTDLSNYYTKSETSGATEISTALGTKVNSATYTGHTADTSVHFTTGAVQTQIDNSISGKVDTTTFDTIVGSGYTNTTITDVIENMDTAIAAALTDLYDKIGDIETILATI